jgi:hypothetical protein
MFWKDTNLYLTRLAEWGKYLQDEDLLPILSTLADTTDDGASVLFEDLMVSAVAIY